MATAAVQVALRALENGSNASRHLLQTHRAFQLQPAPSVALTLSRCRHGLRGGAQPFHLRNDLQELRAPGSTRLKTPECHFPHVRNIKHASHTHVRSITHKTPVRHLPQGLNPLKRPRLIPARRAVEVRRERAGLSHLVLEHQQQILVFRRGVQAAGFRLRSRTRSPSVRPNGRTSHSLKR